jgi:catechol 2,3-dioxygenase-like lactoylglutathione lyase family enzyme
VESAVPILPSRDLRETLAFYERLGFQDNGGPWEEWNYLIVSRSGAEWERVGVPRDETNGSRLEPPVDTDYGIREFALIDPSGNLLRVGSRKT